MRAVCMTRVPRSGRPAILVATMLALGVAGCPKPQSKLPTDLPPPEYEMPRGYDLGGAPNPAPSVTPSAAPSAPPAPKP